jgi:hypothetical protein
VRTIELGGRTVYGTTKSIIDAVAWASIRRGNTPWKGTNVVDIMRQYLLDHGADPDTYNPHRMRYVLRRLDEEGFATLTANGKRFVKFEFKPDVDLRMDQPEFTTKRAAVKAFVSSDDIVLVNDDDSGLPIPNVKPERYQKDELDRLLDAFWEAKPETYSNYIDRLIQGLKSVLE